MVFQIQSPQKFSSRIVQEKDEDLYNALLKFLLVCFVFKSQALPKGFYHRKKPTIELPV